jgi:hypothetical protein
MARENNTVTASRIASDPAFERTRENNREFGRAGKAGQLIRTGFRSLVQNVSDNRMVSRLTAELMKVVQADQTSTRGQRNVLDGELELLQFFDFNQNAKLSATLYAPFTTTIDRATGVLRISLPSFVPESQIAAPAGATHFKLLSAGASLDFEGGGYESDDTVLAPQALNNVATAAVQLDSTVPANNTQPLLLLLGIEFYQEVNGSLYTLKNGAFNALQIVAVNSGV